MTLTDLKNSFERRLTIENRCFHIQEDKSNNFFRLDLNTVQSKNIQQSWRPGTIRNACDEILAPRMKIDVVYSELKKKTMIIHTPDISRNFILDTAVHEATNILLKSYLTSSVSSSSFTNIIHIHGKDSELINSKQNRIKISRSFLTRMATIAWHFLDISVIFHETTGQDKDSN